MRFLTVPLCLLALAAPSSAEVKIGTRPDGRKLIYNEAPEHRVRRAAGVLLPVPEAHWAPLIEEHSTAQGLQSRLVRAVIQVESGYNSRALSNKGAMGLMQLMPATALDLAVDDPYDPSQNLRGGTTYLRRLLDRFEDRLEWALAAYNAGPTAVERHRGIPPYRETRDYVARVLGLYRSTGAGLAATGLPSGRSPFIVRRDGRILLTTDPGLLEDR